MEAGNIAKAAAFKRFFHLSHKNTHLLFLNIFHEKTLIDEFCGLHKNMKCTFPLRAPILKNICERLLLRNQIFQVLNI